MTERSIYGTHDAMLDEFVLDNPQCKWVLFARAVGHDDADFSGDVYSPWSEGLGQKVIVRFQHAFGKGGGCIPLPQFYESFARRIANYLDASPGIHSAIVGNEFQLKIERPDGQDISPESAAECFVKVWREAKIAAPHVLLSPGAIAPWNVDYQGLDWLKYQLRMLNEIERLGVIPDFLTVHTYTHGTDPELVLSPAKMNAPYGDRYYNFLAFTQFLNSLWVPASMRGLPVYITETDQDEPWANVNSGWVQGAYQVVDGWNQSHEQQIQCLLLYRTLAWDKYGFEDKGGVLADFVAAMEHDYTYKEKETNMGLTNGGLNLPYIVVPGHDNCRVAWDWTAWAKTNQPVDVDVGETGDCAYPEYKPIMANVDPKRIIEGDATQCWFLTNKRMNAGVMQQVAVGTGNWCTFSAHVETWCSNEDDPYTDDGEMYARVLIDPRGGFDPEAECVVRGQWHRCRAEYDVIEVQAVAEANSVTVFVQFWNKWKMEHNDAYLGKAELTVTGDVPPDDPPVDPPEDPPVDPPVDGTLTELLDAMDANHQAYMAKIRAYLAANKRECLII
jgi:hypothetical protein